MYRIASGCAVFSRYAENGVNVRIRSMPDEHEPIGFYSVRLCTEYLKDTWESTLLSIFTIGKLNTVCLIKTYTRYRSSCESTVKPETLKDIFQILNKTKN